MHFYFFTGIITFVGENYVLIDGNLFYELDPYKIFEFSINDKITYVAYKDKDQAIKVLRILQNIGNTWGDPDDTVRHYSIINHVVVGEVGMREDRFVYIKDTNLKYSLDEVETNIAPMPGDWLEINCTVQWDANTVKEVTANQVIFICVCDILHI